MEYSRKRDGLDPSFFSALKTRTLHWLLFMARKHYTVRLFSLIQTAVINGLDPYRYLEYALKNVGRKPIETILPYSKDLEIR